MLFAFTPIRPSRTHYSDHSTPQPAPHKTGREEGQALIELALLLPFLALFIFGVVKIGAAFGLKQHMTQLAGEGARYASVNSCPSCGGQSLNQILLDDAPQSIRDNAVVRIQFASLNGSPAPHNHCKGSPVSLAVVWPNYTIITSMFNIDLGSGSTFRMEADWNGNPATGVRSASDAFDAMPGSASSDTC